MGSALTIDRAQTLLSQLPHVFVRWENHGAMRHLARGRLIRVINNGEVEVQPSKAGTKCVVPIKDVSEWNSQNLQLASQLGVDITVVNGVSGQRPTKVESSNDRNFVIVSKSRRAVYLGQGRWSVNPNHAVKFPLSETLDIVEEIASREEEIHQEQEDDVRYMSFEEALKFIGEMTPIIPSVRTEVSIQSKMDNINIKELVNPSKVMATFVPTQFPPNATPKIKLETIHARQRAAYDQYIISCQMAKTSLMNALGCNEEMANLMKPMLDEVTDNIRSSREEVVSTAATNGYSETTPDEPLVQRTFKHGELTEAVILFLNDNPGATTNLVCEKIHTTPGSIGALISALKTKNLVKVVDRTGRAYHYELTTLGKKKAKSLQVV